MVYSIISIAICTLLFLAVRQFDKKQGSLEKVKRYVEKLHGEFEAFPRKARLT